MPPVGKACAPIAAAIGKTCRACAVSRASRERIDALGCGLLTLGTALALLLASQPTPAHADTTAFAIERERQVLDDREAFRSYLADRVQSEPSLGLVPESIVFFGDALDIRVSEHFTAHPDDVQSGIIRELARQWSLLTPRHTAAVNLVLEGGDLPYRSASYTPSSEAQRTIGKPGFLGLSVEFSTDSPESPQANTSYPDQ